VVATKSIDGQLTFFLSRLGLRKQQLD